MRRLRPRPAGKHLGDPRGRSGVSRERGGSEEESGGRPGERRGEARLDAGRDAARWLHLLQGGARAKWNLSINAGRVQPKLSK